MAYFTICCLNLKSMEDSLEKGHWRRMSDATTIYLPECSLSNNCSSNLNCCHDMHLIRSLNLHLQLAILPEQQKQ